MSHIIVLINMHPHTVLFLPLVIAGSIKSFSHHTV